LQLRYPLAPEPAPMTYPDRRWQSRTLHGVDANDGDRWSFYCVLDESGKVKNVFTQSRRVRDLSVRQGDAKTRIDSERAATPDALWGCNLGGGPPATASHSCISAGSKTPGLMSD